MVASSVVFAISLKPKRGSQDWEDAQANLRRTLRSIDTAKLAERAIAAVACHDEPELRTPGRARLHVLRVPFDEPATLPAADREKDRDKARKRRFIGAWLRQHLAGGAVYVMFLDADDLVHRNVVDHVLGRECGSYVIDDGYFYDVETGVMWRQRHGFHRSCGSSFVCRFEPDELPSTWEDTTSPFAQFGTPPDQRGHEEYDAVAEELGRPPSLIPFPAVLYTVNHNESLWRARSATPRRSNSPRALIRPAAARRILAEDFGAADFAARAAGTLRFAAAVTRAGGARARALARERVTRLRALE